jgi:hypothetical protein
MQNFAAIPVQFYQFRFGKRVRFYSNNMERAVLLWLLTVRDRIKVGGAAGNALYGLPSATRRGGRRYYINHDQRASVAGRPNSIMGARQKSRQGGSRRNSRSGKKSCVQDKGDMSECGGKTISASS